MGGRAIYVQIVMGNGSETNFRVKSMKGEEKRKRL